MRSPSFFSSMRISTSGMLAQRIRMNIIASNIANAETTRTKSGGPYRRRVVALKEREVPFKFLVEQSTRIKVNTTNRMHIPQPKYGVKLGEGVEVVAIKEDKSPFKLVYDPKHPDADERGYVRLPNVDIVQEVADLMVARRAYEANIQAFNVAKHMALKSMSILV